MYAKSVLFCGLQVDHTITIYLVDPNGEFVDYYGRVKKREEITASVLSNKQKFEMLNRKGWTESITSSLSAVKPSAGQLENK